MWSSPFLPAGAGELVIEARSLSTDRRSGFPDRIVAGAHHNFNPAGVDWIDRRRKYCHPANAGQQDEHCKAFDELMRFFSDRLADAFGSCPNTISWIAHRRGHDVPTQKGRKP